MRDLRREDLTVAALFVWFMSLNIGMNYLLRWAMHTLAVPTFQASLDSVCSENARLQDSPLDPCHLKKA